MSSHRDIFSQIYFTNLWGSQESVSGSGSELANTLRLIDLLQQFIIIGQVKKIVDAPCGDFNWMQKVISSDIEYLGIDIVEELIKDNLRKYPNVSFEIGDVTTFKYPTCDLIVCRDCLVHFSFEDIKAYLSNVLKTNFKFLAVTNFIGSDRQNAQIITGSWRPLNFFKPPFNLPYPEFNILEDCEEDNGMYRDKSLSIFSYEQIQKAHACMTF